MITPKMTKHVYLNVNNTNLGINWLNYDNQPVFKWILFHSRKLENTFPISYLKIIEISKFPKLE